MQQHCNFGYGRGLCERFPAEAEADAVRFHIASDSGELIRLQYVLERECWPISYGIADFSVSTNRFAAGLRDEILERQAAAFVESYRRRSGK